MISYKIHSIVYIYTLAIQNSHGFVKLKHTLAGNQAKAIKSVALSSFISAISPILHIPIETFQKAAQLSPSLPQFRTIKPLHTYCALSSACCWNFQLKSIALHWKFGSGQINLVQKLGQKIKTWRGKYLIFMKHTWKAKNTLYNLFLIRNFYEILDFVAENMLDVCFNVKKVILIFKQVFFE